MIKAPGNAEESGKGEDAEGGELGQVPVPRIRTLDGLERVGKRSNSETSPPSEFDAGSEPRRSREAESGRHSWERRGEFSTPLPTHPSPNS